MNHLGYPDVDMCYLVSSSIPEGRDSSLVSVDQAVTIQGFCGEATNPMDLEDRAGGPRGQGIESKRLVLKV